MAMRKLKVAVGMSGGVDSSLSAALLKEQGCEVTGVFLDCWDESGCGVNQGKKDALKVVLKLKIPFKVLDFKKDYQKKVIDWFYRELRKGRTPNPDVMCNKEIKFGLFLDWAMKNDFDYIATGHYARIEQENAFVHPALQKDVGLKLLRGVDKKKDQTYFLYGLNQEQLSKVMFPIGGMKKDKVRQKTKKRGLHVWNKKDSVGICFIGNKISFNEFVKRKVKEHEGEVIDKKGKIIGSHKGVEFYTIGQRHGFIKNSKLNRRPRLFVVRKNIEKNQLIVEIKEDLKKRQFRVEKWHWINPNYKLQVANYKLKCRIRHQGRLINCKIDGKKVKLNQSEFGVAVGQVCVVYCGEECLGGGIIKN